MTDLTPTERARAQFLAAGERCPDCTSVTTVARVRDLDGWVVSTTHSAGCPHWTEPTIRVHQHINLGRTTT